MTRKQMAGLSPETAVRDGFCEGLYGRQASEATYAELLRVAEGFLGAGRSMIIDASFILKSQRTLFAGLARKYSVPLIILHAVCNEPEIRRRLIDREAGGRSVSDGRAELLALQAAGFEAPDDAEGTVITLSTDALPASLTNQVYARLSP
jgi:predicted kinase